MKKNTTKSKYVVPIIYGMMALWFFLDKEYILSVTFCLVAILWMLFYPAYYKRKLISNYKKLVDEQYKNAFNRSIVLELQAHQILLKDPGSESQINIAEVVKIVEIPSYFVIGLKSAQKIYIPMYKLENKEDVRSAVYEISKERQIPFEKISNWNWD